MSDIHTFTAIALIAEEKILAAIEAGEFENLEGHGKALKLEENSNIAPEARMAWKILKNSGYLHEGPKSGKEKSLSTMMREQNHEEAQKCNKIKRFNVLMRKARKKQSQGSDPSLDPLQAVLENSPYFERLLEKI